jgi:hypothetical protein
MLKKIVGKPVLLEVQFAPPSVLLKIPNVTFKADSRVPA